MEVDEIQCNNNTNFPQMNNDVEEPRDTNNHNNNNQQLAAVDRFYGGWPSSRIVRVSRASGGKDRHSKVLTSKGLRDRRVRLSVNTAIQFYDLQDRLGYDQPSKAVEWLLKAAASSIAELPQICAPFGDNKLLQVGTGSDDKRSMSNGDGSDHLGFDRGEGDGDGAAVSSNSETSKGSGLSLSRSENRIKARERAKGRVAENNGSKFRLQEKEKENEALNPNISQTTSFTELLSGTGATTNHDLSRSWSSTPMDYFTSGLLTPPPQFSTVQGGCQNYPFVPENLNFTISSSVNNSSGLAGYNRGTLQSNSSFHRFSAINNNDGSSSSFLMENQNQNQNQNQQQLQQFFSGFDGRLHLCYGDAANANNGNRGGKGKN